ncbi:hypothetical protein MBLNU459_g3865t1 [Dothideomycetes sp. NU459]
MADSDPPELAAALLRWVQAFGTPSKVETWRDLQDGWVLWAILQDIDPSYFEGDLPEPPSKTKDNWIPRWQNLKQVNRLVTAYLRDASESLDSQVGRIVPDLKAIATDASAQDTVMLLKTMLRAAMYSPESNQRMGRIVVGLGPDIARTIAAAMQEMEETDLQATESIDRSDLETTPGVGTSTELESEPEPAPSTERPSTARDPELEQEEKLIQAFKTIKDLQDNNAKAAVELEELRQDKEELQQAFDAFKYEVETEGQKRVENDSIKELQHKTDRDRDYIAELETELDNIRTTSQTQERQIERYKADGDAKQKLRDDLQLLRVERDELLQKSRANENLKKKIQALQDQEKANSTLKEDLKMANEQLQSMDRLKEQCTVLQKANAENMTTIANGEQEIFDQKTTRKRMEHEYKVLVQKWEASKERQSRDHETITELETRLQILESEGNADNSGLDHEIAASETSEAVVTKSQSAVTSADISILQQKLDALAARNNKLETEYLDILQDKLGLETAIEDLKEPSREPEENIPFLEQRKKLQAINVELAELRNLHFSTTADLASAKERLLATADQSLDGKTEYQVLTDRYAELHKHSEGVEAELSDQRSLLRHALLGAPALLKEPEESRQGIEYKLLLQQLQAIRETPEDDELCDKTAANLSARIEGARSEGSAAIKRAEEHASEVAELREKLAAASNDHGKAGQVPSQEFAALQRENRLMTSAWFDLSSRLQSNTTMLGRRKESPKSFLGKQRALVTPSIAVGQHRR